MEFKMLFLIATSLVGCLFIAGVLSVWLVSIYCEIKQRRAERRKREEREKQEYTDKFTHDYTLYNIERRLVKADYVIGFLITDFNIPKKAVEDLFNRTRVPDDKDVIKSFKHRYV